MFIVSITYKKKLADVDRHLDAHVAYLKNCYMREQFIASGRKKPRTGGVIIANIATREELDEVLSSDPFYRADIADYDVIEFAPTMTGKGFEAFLDFPGNKVC